MTRFTGIALAILMSSLYACKPTTSHLTDAASSAVDAGREHESELWIPRKFVGKEAEVLKLIMGVRNTITGQEMRAALEAHKGNGGDFLLLSPIFRQPFNKPVVSPVEPDVTGERFRTITLFQGTGIGTKLFILYSQFTMRETEYQKDTSLGRLIRAADYHQWRVAAQSARSLLENFPIPDADGRYDVSRPLIDKAMHHVDTYFTGPAAWDAVMSGLDMVDATARFIPGYAGAHDLFYGDSKWQTGVGLILLAADAIPLVGSVSNASRAVRVGSQSFLAVGAATRIVDGIKTAVEGNAGLGTAVDVTFAMVEGSLYAFTRVRLRVKTHGTAATSELSDVIADIAHNADLNARGRIHVADDASANHLAALLGGQRSAADIRANGLTPNELIDLISENPAQTRAQVQAKAASQPAPADSAPPSFATNPSRSLNPCSGFSLLNNDLCDLARLSPSERKVMRQSYETRSQAFSAAKHEGGGYFGQMEEIQPLYTDPQRPANGNVGYRPMRGVTAEGGGPAYTREYWYKNADGQIIVIQDHSAGHPGLTNGEFRHFNVRYISPEAQVSPAALLDALDSAGPPPNLPAVGHYDFGTID